MTFVDTLLESLKDLGQRDQTIARYFIDHTEEEGRQRFTTN